MFSTEMPILLADIFDWLGGLVGIVLLVAWVFRQIFEANKQAAPARGQPQAAPRPVQGQAQPRRPMPADGEQADPLRSQVEEFLRRSGHLPAAGQEAAGQRRAQAGGRRDVEVLIDEAAAPREERKPLAEPFRSMSQPYAGQSSQPTAPRKQRPRRPAASRQERMAEDVTDQDASQPQEVAAQVSRLGQRIIDDDHQFDVQLKAKFDHKVGTLTGSGVAAAERAAADAREAALPASQIAAMLRTPDGVRQAIVVNEILRRPNERW